MYDVAGTIVALVLVDDVAVDCIERLGVTVDRGLRDVGYQLSLYTGATVDCIAVYS